MKQLDAILESKIVTPQAEEWLRGVLRRRSRYKNLEPKLSHFTVDYYYPGRGRRACLMLYGWHRDTGKAVPLPKSALLTDVSIKTRVLKRLRLVIEDQILPLRRRGYHVDHVYPFERIVVDWMAIEGIKEWGKVTARLYPRFYDYHKAVATFQHLTPAANRSKSNRLEPESNPE